MTASRAVFLLYVLAHEWLQRERLSSVPRAT